MSAMRTKRSKNNQRNDKYPWAFISVGPFAAYALQIAVYALVEESISCKCWMTYIAIITIKSGIRCKNHLIGYTITIKLNNRFP